MLDISRYLNVKDVPLTTRLERTITGLCELVTNLTNRVLSVEQMLDKVSARCDELIKENDKLKREKYELELQLIKDRPVNILSFERAS